ncbi:MmcQ/YjbR family DNA-binding protein [Solimonas terrae]|uniref:MmcQ/YjbR family DNA-binding protein n=1 Tax=Solimonas terrae TaxID=1396819 RepID=A0A6M2BRW6_9GAMM|nr:MmcQ/YjbR family DNA-binding protein [Solimonas terrae]NGY04843.1 MmcQ/YjbR family DNA-binding protein [Solimonas terrae]
MKLATIRKQALALPEVTEEPHFHYTSFRVAGKIFVTAPHEETHIHVFVGEEERERTLTLYPEFAEKLMWGARAAGLRIALAAARPAAVSALLRKAWTHKAPKRLQGALDA